ncbi:MAG: DHH family phosphoesterase [Bacilli bacterium]|nr:DHH family phosphoesterase [Bacilli bacterium]
MEHLFNKLNEIINEYDNFIVMGHKDPDLDSLGSSLGLCEIIESFNKKAYLFLNDKHLDDYNSNISQAFQSFEKMKKDIVCVNQRSYRKIKGDTLLIVVDVHSQDRLEYPELVNIYDTIVLDHHIKNKDYIKDTKFLYVDSNLSSMSELITYYAEFVNIDLDNVIATILLAGIEIDTNGFNLKTTSSTYEAASTLMEMGADSILKQELLKESKEEYMKRATFIRNSFMATNNIAMCLINTESTTKELAEVAQELLTFEDVKASFVIGKLDENIIGVSARSLGHIDVSTTIKQLGGGGNSSNAAVQIKNKTLKEVKQEIIDMIK